MKFCNRQKGYTLVELMIALALGLFLSAGIVALYIQSKNSFWQDEEMARIQENGRYALQLLAREIRMAGFVGGVENPDTINTGGLSVGNDCGTNWALDATAGLEVVNDTASTLGEYSCSTGGLVDGTDVIVIKRVLDEAIIDNGLWLDGYSELVGNRIYLRSENRGLGIANFGKGSNVVQSGDVVDPGKVSEVEADPTKGSLVNIWEYDISLFHVANNDDGIPSLARYTLDASGDISGREFLVEGVEDLQLELGLDINGDGQPQRFVAESTNPPSTTVGAVDTEQVVAVRVYLLSRSLQARANAPTRAMTYKLGSKVVTTNDNINRRVFSSTVMLRNPAYGIN